ncbi:MAG: HTTM domain-containing protein [Planctomycetales bacterium]|nr:HTTM domain-containing protein [Planctomycetales bacterium]
MSLLRVPLRSLAACRIGLASVMLVDLTTRFGEVEIFLSKRGLLPLELQRELTSGGSWWTLYAFSDSPVYAWMLLATQLVCTLLLLAGAWTRYATVALWLLTMSLHVRNPLVNNSGDMLLRMMLFWGMFAPWGACWSLDAVRRRRGGLAPPGRDAPVWPSVLLPIQVSLVYLVTGWLKLNDVWLSGEAMQRVVELDFCVRPGGRWLAEHPQWLAPIAACTLWLELLGPIVVWSPWKSASVRVIVVAAFWALHLGVEAVMHVGLFGWVSMAAWLVFLPNPFWDRLGDRLGRRTRPSVESSPESDNTARHRGAWRWLVTGICGYAMAVALAANLLDIWRVGAEMATDANGRLLPGQETETEGGENLPPTWLVGLLRSGEPAYIDQEWTMFHVPPTRDSWLVARADLESGEQIDVLRRGQPWDATGSPATARELPSQHWRYYLRRLSFERHRSFRQRAADVLLEQWNGRHPQRPAVRLTLIEFAQTFGEEGFETRVLASASSTESTREAASEANEPLQIDLEGALDRLNSPDPFAPR